MIHKTTYIDLLPEPVQKQIRDDLERKGIHEEFIKMALCSRISDLEDTIDITKYLNTKL